MGKDISFQPCLVRYARESTYWNCLSLAFNWHTAWGTWQDSESFLDEDAPWSNPAGIIVVCDLEEDEHEKSNVAEKLTLWQTRWADDGGGYAICIKNYAACLGSLRTQKTNSINLCPWSCFILANWCRQYETSQCLIKLISSRTILSSNTTWRDMRAGD